MEQAHSPGGPASRRQAFREPGVPSPQRPAEAGPAKECGWQGNHMGVIIYSSNANHSSSMPSGVLECDDFTSRKDRRVIS